MPTEKAFTKHSFLKQVFYLACISFGGPQAHYVLFQKKFIHQFKWITQEEFNELFALCQILPGPSSTQLITLFAYRKSGARFALLSLLIWLLPSCILMALFSFGIPYFQNNHHLDLSVFAFLLSFVLALLLHNTSFYIQQYIKNRFDSIVLILLSVLFVFYYHSPWVFILILIACLVLTFARYPFKSNSSQQNSIRPLLQKRFLILFLSIFALAGFLSEQARIHQWQYRKSFNLFENTYRFGGTIFGGGNVLASVMYEQYAVRSKTQYVQKQDAIIGMALSQATPGPVFAYATYIGGLIFSHSSWQLQALGCLIATIGIFLPGYFLSIFCFQVWHYLKRYIFLPQLLQAIHISICVILLGTFIFLFQEQHLYEWHKPLALIHSAYILLVFFLLQKNYASILFLFFLSMGLGIFT